MRHLSSHPDTAPAGSKAPTFRKTSFIYSLWFYPQPDSEVWFLALWSNNKPKLSPKTDRAVSFSCSFLCSNETLCVGASSHVLRHLNRRRRQTQTRRLSTGRTLSSELIMRIKRKHKNWHERQTSASSEILHVYSHFAFMMHNLNLCRLKKSKHIFFIHLKKNQTNQKSPQNPLQRGDRKPARVNVKNPTNTKHLTLNRSKYTVCVCRVYRERRISTNRK